MKFTKHGKELEKYFVKAKPFDLSESNILKSLENTIDQIKNKKPEILQKFVTKFTKKLEEKDGSKTFEDNSGKLKEEIAKYNHLTESYELLLLMLGYFSKTLEITEKQYWENKVYDFPDWNFFHSVRDLQMMEIKVLIDILGREEAISFYKEIVDHYIVTYDQNQEGWYKDLEEMRQEHMKFIDLNTWGRVRLLSNVEDGQYVEICLTCDKVRSFENVSEEDGILLDVTGCYCHKSLAKLWNENFVLTLNTTLAKGDPFCIYVFHDTRIVDEIKEPTMEFFSKIVEKFTN